MSNHKKLAVDYFERHQASNECHITSDDRVFHTKGSAESFVATLEDQKISSFTRKSIESKNEDIDEDQLVLKLAELEATELVKENYHVLKALVKYFEIEVADQKCETLIQALTDYKLKLQE
ncbi:hypothetical protein [Flavobacterium psychrophilum]|uniref:hypothetical protein n=1 Tax=Flavobacterium psychrophilum TaxID=96345 RepID=UPI000B7C3E95|nr:hypothetical protein [Flavobacterium psychrophilum]EKT3967129.1 hypothetical protein [Flavobacterium psychrophilum]MCB6070913.1 hypothetical protein [Flavobacterium psychrophilum]MCB6108196.1 hypothetical protein [Flavobacterium psychrophilum]SNB07176.1 hypothetical protein IT2_350100 [Flavobacterium psychrophilum]SNB44107.1 hypothetical protein LVDJXP189_790011 [Flavobacterium psychrophilum]